MDRSQTTAENKSSMLTVLLIFISIIILIALITPSVNSSVKNGKVTKVISGWSLLHEDGTSEIFDSFGKELESGVVTISHPVSTLPADTTSIGFYNYYSAVDVHVGDEHIYNYGTKADLDNGYLIGNYYSMVHIFSEDRRGEDLILTFTSNEKQTIYPVYCGSGSALEMAMIRDYLPSLFLPFVTLFMIVMGIILISKKITRDLMSIRYAWIIAFAACLSIWGIVDSQLLMDLGCRAGGVCFVSFEIYMLLPIPLLMFMNNSCSILKRADLHLCYLTILNFIVLNFLHFAGICTFLHSLLTTHLTVGAAMFLALVQVIHEYDNRKSRENAYLLYGFLAFFISAVIQYLIFFDDPTGTNSNIMLLGASAFLILQMSAIFHEVNGRIGGVTKRLEKQNALLTKAFGSFIPDEVVQSIVDAPERINVGGGEKDLTVLSSDIRGFTELIQSMTAKDAIDMLNHYLEAMTGIISRRGGIIMEFVGDGILATFSADKSGENHADRAVFTAIDMQNNMEDINSWNAAHGYPVFEMGIGINTGSAFLGYIGSQARIKYDAIGSTINFGARVESYSTGGQIIISESTKAAVSVRLEISDSYKELPKGALSEVALYVLAGIGAPYNYRCLTSAESPVTLKDPISASYKIIEDKHCSAEVYAGTVTALGERSATFITNIPLKMFDNIRFVSPILLSGKVVSKSKNGYLLRFTSAPKFREELDLLAKKEDD